LKPLLQEGRCRCVCRSGFSREHRITNAWHRLPPASRIHARLAISLRARHPVRGDQGGYDVTHKDDRHAGATPAFAPIDAAQRIQALDVIRGFALLGIFLMNIEWFSRPMQEMGWGIDPAATGLDLTAAWAVHVFVAGKFWVLFSLLFGMGFAVMSSRGGHGPQFRGHYLRRCLVLLVLGVLHA